MNNNILLTLNLIGAFCSLPSHREGRYIAYCLVKSMFFAYFILIYFYLKGHQRPDEAFSALSIEEHSSSEEGESDNTQELTPNSTREDQLSGRTRPLLIFLPNYLQMSPSRLQ